MLSINKVIEMMYCGVGLVVKIVGMVGDRPKFDTRDKPLHWPAQHLDILINIFIFPLGFNFS